MGKKSGFTLAEIIITITIIGTIAATAIPSVFYNIQEKQFKTSWKSAYLTLDQATRLIMNDNGGKMAGFCGGDWQTNCMLNKYAERLNFVKKCYKNEIADNCWHSSYKHMNGNQSANIIDYSGIILANGALIKFIHTRNNCNYTEDNWATIPICGEMDVDINGFSGPNTVGKDIFGIWLQNDGIKPIGTDGDTHFSISTDCSKSETGFACSALYLSQ